MNSHPLSAFDLEVRGRLTRLIYELGFAPSNEHLASLLGTSTERVEQSLVSLQQAHALQLHPNSRRPWVVHPFSLSPGSCWVEIGQQGWWANCLYCGMGIAAAVGREASIHTRLGGESRPLVVRIRNGQVLESDILFHLSTPVRRWWDNVVHACATFQPFLSEEEIDDWCARHDLPRGAVVPLPRMWRFAAEWYGRYLDENWRKRTVEEARSAFINHGFVSDFWDLPEHGR